MPPCSDVARDSDVGLLHHMSAPDVRRATPRERAAVKPVARVPRAPTTQPASDGTGRGSARQARAEQCDITTIGTQHRIDSSGGATAGPSGIAGRRAGDRDL
jgi:hypothetical protein